MQLTKEIICLKCKNLTPNEMGSLFCKAFPDKEIRTPAEVKEREDEGITLNTKGIPDEIIFGESGHTEPCCDQVGDFVFTPIEK